MNNVSRQTRRAFLPPRAHSSGLYQSTLCYGFASNETRWTSTPPKHPEILIVLAGGVDERSEGGAAQMRAMADLRAGVFVLG